MHSFTFSHQVNQKLMFDEELLLLADRLNGNSCVHGILILKVYQSRLWLD